MSCSDCCSFLVSTIDLLQEQRNRMLACDVIGEFNLKTLLKRGTGSPQTCLRFVQIKRLYNWKQIDEPTPSLGSCGCSGAQQRQLTVQESGRQLASDSTCPSSHLSRTPLTRLWSPVSVAAFSRTCFDPQSHFSRAKSCSFSGWSWTALSGERLSVDRCAHRRLVMPPLFLCE